MKKIATLVAATSLRAFATNAPRVEPELTGAAIVAMPVRANKRGSESKYPFDTLTAAGMAFGVKNKTAANLASIVSNANRKYIKPVLDADGKPVYETKELTGADGTKTIVPNTDKPKTEATRRFFAYDVTPEYRKENAALFAKGATFEGATTLVFRES